MMKAWHSPFGIRAGEINLVTSSEKIPVLDNPLVTVDNYYFKRLFKLIDDRIDTGQLTTAFKFKFLSNTNYPICKRIATDRHYGYMPGYEPIDQLEAYREILSHTDTWEEEWIRVFNRHRVIVNMDIGFQDTCPYYGNNITLFNCSRLMV